jgi:hypothetical protein
VIEWFTYLQLAVAVAAGLLCLGLGFAGRKPTDLSMGAAALVELLLIVQLVVAIVAPLTGNEATGWSSTPTWSAPSCCHWPGERGRSSNAAAGAR